MRSADRPSFPLEYNRTFSRVAMDHKEVMLPRVLLNQVQVFSAGAMLLRKLLAREISPVL